MKREKESGKGDREIVKKKESDKIEGGDGRLNVWWG